ncbi:MAG: four helix bundle protein [Patescibacteria group bacterium]
MKTYEDLEVYKRAYRLGIEIYKFTFTLPKDLQYDLADDIRRAARSIISNIAEGYGRRKSNKDTSSYLKISLGSCFEVNFNLKFMKDLDLIVDEKYEYFSGEYTICAKQLNRLIASLTK